MQNLKPRISKRFRWWWANFNKSWIVGITACEQEHAADGD
jgi:hypothetical protein